ncbi:MAG: hypothetical protein KIT73_00600 [Burkholderiales bacterium]|nr:hypothetical protein [Burkholderiales bacterium]
MPMAARRASLHSVPAAADDAAHGTALLAAAGQWWAWGAPMDWSALQRAADSRRRATLPSYPFRTATVLGGFRCPVRRRRAGARDAGNRARQVWAPAWQRRSIPTGTASVAERQNWLLLLDATGVGRALARQIERAGYDVLTVVEATAFAQRDYREFGLDPLRVDQFRELRTALAARELSPTRIVDLRNLDRRPKPNHATSERCWRW